MTRIAVVSYPAFDESALHWIESIRGQHDPQASRLLPHFTLVFPVEVTPADVTLEIARVVAGQTPISFVVRSAAAVPDVGEGGAHIFLVPDEGRDQIVRLHDDLYAGVLRPHLREDITFVPHITIAAHTDVRWCEAYADNLNQAMRPVRGEIESVTLIDVSATEIRSLAGFELRTNRAIL